MMSGIRHFLSRGVSLLALLATVSCATYHVNQKLPVAFDRENKPRMFKRIEQHPERDFLHRWSRTAYLRAPEHPRGAPDAEFATIISEFGNPDWIRKSFRSLEDERVEEWVYLDAGRIFQFIGNHVVYEGPLTDYEQTLLRYGYPDSAMSVLAETGTRVDTFTYNRVFGFRLEIFKFENDRIAQSRQSY